MIFLIVRKFDPFQNWRMKRHLVSGLWAILVLALIYLVSSSSRVDPLPYDPPSIPSLSGPYTPNDELLKARLFGDGIIIDPEDVEIDRAGNMYGGQVNGEIARISPDGRMETFTNTDGRPFGLRFGRDGRLYVADAIKGLLSIDSKGSITVLSTKADNVPFKFTDHLDVASDGTVYFSDASSKFGPGEYLYDLLESRAHGRLLKYDPVTKKTTVLMSGLFFANGVALSRNEDFLVLNETYRYRIHKYWLKGPKAGSSEIFLDNLPGFPDNISANRNGHFWLALFTVRNPLMDFLHPHPLLKKLLSKLPRFLWPRPKKYGLIVEIDESGKVLRTFHDPSGSHVPIITGAKEANGAIYFGSLHGRWLARLPLP